MIGFKGSYTLVCDFDCYMELISDSEFSVYQLYKDDFMPIGPKSCQDRTFSRKCKAGDELHFETEGKCSLNVEERKSGETPYGNKLVENIPVEELSVYDRLRSELLEAMSDYAGNHGAETIDEFDDYEFEDEDAADIPLTPYEAVDMYDEYLRDDPQEAITATKDEESIPEVSPPVENASEASSEAPLEK